MRTGWQAIWFGSFGRCICSNEAKVYVRDTRRGGPMYNPIDRRTIRLRCGNFFRDRCLAGFPWFWAARPGNDDAMVEARRIVRRHFGCDHHPLYRIFAKIFATIAWPPSVLLHLWQIRQERGPDAVPIKRAPSAFWAAMRHNVLPGEYYAYGLWNAERKAKIDKYLSLINRRACSEC